MDLSSPSEDRVAAAAAARSSRVRAYVAVVSCLGVLGLVVVVAQTDWGAVVHSGAFWTIAFLALAALLGEVKPLTIARGDEPAESVSTSTPFVFALLSVGGVGVAVVAQLVASLADDLLRRRDPTKSLFNLAQLTLSVMGARWVYASLAGLDFFGGPVFVEFHELGPLLLAGVTMVLLNRVMVAVAVAIASGLPLRMILADDAGFFASTHGVMLCIGAAAANVAASGAAFVALLCAPAVAVYLTAAAAVRQAYQANHDTLTGLGNRDRLNSSLGGAITAAHGDPALGPGLVLIDLDHFKDINDTLGHPVGDMLLRKVADRLAGALVERGALAHRLGGDEFAVVVRAGQSESEALAHRLLASLEAPIEVAGTELLVRGSAGVAVAPDHGADAATLMKNADIALYQAKRERDRTQVYSPRFDVNTVERLGLLSDLRAALDTGQLTVAFQPQVDLVDRRVVAVEALIRWNHPTRGPVPPDSFIPLAENSGLIAELTAYVLDTALATLAGWRADGHDLRMSVNLSARQLSDLTLPDQVGSALHRHRVPASALVLEVTETGILSDPARVDVVIADLRARGVSIAVDDYGTGQASLNYLKRLRIDELKIDKSFVSDMARDRHDFIIVRSTISLARDLGLRVVAEGIQEEDTATSLRDLGCSVGQGYHLGRPTTPDDVRGRLEAEATAAAAAARRTAGL